MTDSWYGKLLCGWNKLGDFADVATRGTDIELLLTDTDKAVGKVRVRCWCCTFWRGILIGCAAGATITACAAAILFL